MKRAVSKLLCRLILIVLLVAVLPPIKSNSIHTGLDGLHAMPPHPDLLEKLAQEGRSLPGFEDKWQRGIDRPGQFPIQPSGNFNILAVTVDFSDRTSSEATSFFDSLLFSQGGPPPTSAGSVKDYFTEVSYGSLTLTTVNLPSVTGWQRAPKPLNGATGYVNANGVLDPPGNLVDDYGWGTYPQNLQGIVADVLPLIDPLIDLSKYDNDGDGFVDSVIFIHAGSGAEFTGSPSDIWSSAWDMTSGGGPGPLMTGDGVMVDNFLFGPEYRSVPTPSDQTIGVYCHEMGHSYFSLPDLYDLDNSSNGVGTWSLMGFGSWNGPSGRGGSPAWPDAWSRIVMGFDFPVLTDGDLLMWPFWPVQNGPPGQVIVKLKSPQLGPKEYFLVEYRNAAIPPPPPNPGFDAFLPGSGLLIWHVDEDKWNLWEGNDFECTSSPCCTAPCNIWHPLVALEQADGLFDLENKINLGDTGDPFPGTTNNITFTFGTIPESGSYYANPCPSDSCIAVKNINASFPVPILADLHVACQSAGACLNIMPELQDGWGQPGTDVVYKVSVQNCSNAFEFAVTLQTNSAWPSTVFNWGTGVPMTQTSMFPGAAWYTGITVTVPSTATWGASDVLTLTALSGNNPLYTSSNQLTTHVPYCTLVVDDDRGNPDVESIYQKALTNNKFDYDYWDMGAMGPPDPKTLAAHQAVVWFTGAPRVDTLHHRDEIDLATYLDQGGQLFLSSQDYLYDAGRTAFSREYLHVATYIDDTGTNQVTGAVGNPVGSGLGTFTLSTPATNSDRISPHPTVLTSTAFVDSGGFSNALTHDGGLWRTLFLAWPFENLFQPDADALMSAAMDWFGIPPRPTANFTPSDTLVCAGDTVTFTNNSQDASAYLWDFGDGGSSTSSSPTHSYTTPTTATVKLTSTNCCGYDVDSETIAVYNAPTAGFTASADAVPVGNTVVFTNTSLNATSYLWDFGDGGTSILANPSHAYAAPITATVTLTASSPCRDDVYIHTLKVYAPPVAGFIPSASTIGLGQTVSFTNTSTNATTYHWDFGDGVGASEMIHPSYTYTQTGAYTVTLIASNLVASDTMEKQIQVNPVKHYLYLPSITNGTAGNTNGIHSWYDWLKGISLVVVSLGVLGIAKWNPRKGN